MSSLHERIEEIEKKCKECQFEEGHSQSCAKYRENKTFAPHPEKEEWEERFDLIWNGVWHDGPYAGDKRIDYAMSFKSFIHSLLAEEREKIREDVEKLSKSRILVLKDNGKVTSKMVTRGYQKALKDVLTLLSKRDKEI